MNINKKVIDSIVDGMNECIKNNEIPVSAIIIDKDGNIIGKGINNRQGNHNVIGHAEINAILDAERNIGDWRLDGYSMVVSLEPCDMCKSVIKESRLDKVLYLCKSNYSQIVKNDIEIEYYKSDYIDDEYIKKLFTEFFNNKR